MNDTLWQQLDRVGQRYARLRRGLALIVGCAILAAIGVVAIVVASRHGQGVSGGMILGLLAAAAVVVLITNLLVGRSPRAEWVARRIERQHPDLDSRLLTAVEQRPDPDTGRLNYFQQHVVAEALDHARTHRWADVVSPAAWRAVRAGQTVAVAAFALVLAVAVLKQPARGGVATVLPSASLLPKIEPGDTAVERGTGLIVLARYGGQLPSDVKLLTKSAGGTVESAPMSRSMDDPVFAGRLSNVQSDLQYAVVSGQDQSPWYTAKVFDYPELKQADADVRHPAYTKLADRTLEDVRSVTAVEGSTTVLRLKLNKPVAAAELVAADGRPIKLIADPAQPDVVSATINLKQSQRLRLRLVDADKRENKQPAAEFALNVNPNRPPELKPVSPGRDVDVSPIQELTVGVRASDDFGLLRVGLTYGMAGQPTEDVLLASDVPGGQKRDVSHLLSMERMKAQPDQLVSYFFWAEDYAADGTVRRTQSDMYFAEVRPFEEIFRQGEQPSEGEQQRQQQQQSQQQGGNGQQAEELAEAQKQIINATWKIIRRETAAEVSSAFATDVELVRQSQESVREQLGQLAKRVTDAKSKTYVKAVQDHADRAIALLNTAATSKARSALTEALAAEQSAYQALLKLRAREFDVVRGNQQQQQGSQSASSSSSRRQQQLDQLRLDQEQNRYETQRAAATPQENPQQRETRQVLNRLKELAQRQEDLNRQMQELNSALDRAQDPQQREEVQRQLARLRDQQAQQLRDTDELRDRMDRPENQESMADARQQVEQTRENLRRANEALQQSRVPEAAASGARAGEQLDKARDQVRRDSAGQLADGMSQLRDDARRLDQQQQQLSEQLKQLDETRQPGLRDGADRQRVAQQIGQQREQLQKLTDATRKMIDDAETAEPLASKQLYETLRQSAQQQTDQALDAGRQLLDRGLTGPARQATAEADKGVAELRKGIEQAATNVLGDETEALRRASRELDRLAEELQRDVDRNRPAGTTAAGRPTTRPGTRTLAGGATTRPQTSADRGNGPATQPDRRLAEDGRRSADESATTSPSESLASAAGRGRDATRQTDRPGEAGGLRGNRRTAAGEATPSNEPGDRRETDGDRSSQRQAGDQQAGQEPDREAGEQARQQAGAQNGQQPGQRGQGIASNPPGREPQNGQAGRQPGGQSGRPNAGQGRQTSNEQGQPNAERGDGQPTPAGEGQPNQERPNGGEPSQDRTAQAGEGQRGQGQRGQGEQAQGQAREQGQQAGQGEPNGDRPNGGQPNEAQARADRQNGSGTNAGGGNRVGDPNARNNGVTGDPAVDETDGPLTGENFRDWSDRLRDVEEMIGDPRLRDRAASIRDRAREVRAEMKRHSKTPNWDMVQQSIGTPLAELRDQVHQEVARRQSPDALVPLDREAVLPAYAEQVRQYYERLGAGR